MLDSSRWSTRCRARLPAGRECMGACRDRNRVGPWGTARFELLDELRQGCNGFAQYLDDRRSACERVVEQSIEEILDRPGELAELPCADHAAAALQRMERASDRDERIALQRVLVPRGEA